MITAIYPGTYDPVTNGHVDVITRAARIFDRVVVGVVGNPHHKEPMFSVPERMTFLRDALEGVVENVVVDEFSELVVDFARRWNAKAIVKGLRVVSDFEWEFQMNQLNRTLAPEIETVFVMASSPTGLAGNRGRAGGVVTNALPMEARVQLILTKNCWPVRRPYLPNRGRLRAPLSPAFQRLRRSSVRLFHMAEMRPSDERTRT